MAQDYGGRGAFAGFGAESPWGTPVARTNYLRLVSSTLRRVRARGARNALYKGGTAPVVSDHFTESDNVEGTIVVEVEYSSIGLLIEWILGSVNSVGAGSPYTHENTLSAEAPFGMTIEIGRGDGTSEVFEGCFAESATFSVAAGGGPMQLSIDVVGETSGGRVALGTPTYPTTDSPVLPYHAGDLGWNAQTYCPQDFTFTITNGFPRRNCLGSLLTKEPKRGGFIDLSVQSTIDIDDDFYTQHLAETETDLTLNFTGAAISGGNYGLNFTFHNAFIATVDDPVDQPGLLSSSVTWTPSSDLTDDGVQIDVVTDQASNQDPG